MSRIKPPVLHAMESAFVSPTECNSRVGFTIATSRRGFLSGDVVLNDCDRQITWRLYHQEGYQALYKLDEAIRVLTNCRAAWIKATKGRRKKR